MSGGVVIETRSTSVRLSSASKSVVIKASGAPAYSAHLRADSALRLPTATSLVRSHFWYARACSPATHPAPKIAAPRTFLSFFMVSWSSDRPDKFLAPRPPRRQDRQDIKNRIHCLAPLASWRP